MTTIEMGSLKSPEHTGVYIEKETSPTIEEHIDTFIQLHITHGEAAVEYGDKQLAKSNLLCALSSEASRLYVAETNAGIDPSLALETAGHFLQDAYSGLVVQALTGTGFEVSDDDLEVELIPQMKDRLSPSNMVEVDATINEHSRAKTIIHDASKHGVNLAHSRILRVLKDDALEVEPLQDVATVAEENSQRMFGLQRAARLILRRHS